MPIECLGADVSECVSVFSKFMCGSMLTLIHHCNQYSTCTHIHWIARKYKSLFNEMSIGWTTHLSVCIGSTMLCTLNVCEFHKRWTFPIELIVFNYLLRTNWNFVSKNFDGAIFKHIQIYPADYRKWKHGLWIKFVKILMTSILP